MDLPSGGRQNRQTVMRAFLDHFRRKQAISVRCLEETTQQQIRRRSEQHLNEFWGVDPESNELRPASRFLVQGHSSRMVEGYSLGTRSALGRFLIQQFDLGAGEYPAFLDAFLGLMVRQGISGLSPSTTYYIGVKAYDEVLNASTIATASATTPAASNLTRPLLQPDDLEFLGAFKLPQEACGWSTSGARSGIALRRVNGNLQFLTCTHVYADSVYECNFPGWGSDQSTWPQSQLVREWGMDVYSPSLKQQTGDWTAGLNYDQATGRLYYSSCNIYYVSQAGPAVPDRQELWSCLVRLWHTGRRPV